MITTIYILHQFNDMISVTYHIVGYRYDMISATYHIIKYSHLWNRGDHTL